MGQRDQTAPGKKFKIPRVSLSPPRGEGWGEGLGVRVTHDATARDLRQRLKSASHVSLWAIFAGFLRLGCTSFGGGTAGWLYRDIVLRRRWLDDAAFLRAMAIAQALPGANGIKMSLLIAAAPGTGFSAGQQLLGMIVELLRCWPC